MPESRSQIGLTGLLARNPRSSNRSTDPLFLPIKAPAEVGDVTEYKLVLMQRTTSYAMHWNLPDGRKRAMCQGEHCPLCPGHKPPEVYHAAVVLDMRGRRYVIAQMSEALVGYMADAAERYLEWLRRNGHARHVDVCDPADPWQPVFHVKAIRSSAGPRYQVQAQPMRWDKAHDAAKQMSFAEWRGTSVGVRWTSLVEDQTARPLRRALPDFGAFDLLPLIFPEEYTVEESWDADLDE